MKNFQLFLPFVLSMFLVFSISPSHFMPDAYACSCSISDSPKKELQARDAVFSGTVIDIKESQSAESLQFSSDPIAITFEIDEIWKGLDRSNLTTVYTSQSSASCGYGFEIDREYLVYANYDYHDKEQLDVSLCSRTSLLSNASNDIKELGMSLSPIMSPLKQFQSGIAVDEIQCRDSLTLITKHDGSPACVKPESATILIDRGWMIISESNDKPKFTDHTGNLEGFAFSFYSQVATQDERSNVFFSPLGISTAFSIAYEGAKENTASQMQQIFDFEENDSKRQEMISDTMMKLNHEDDWYKLDIANALWIKEGYKIKPDYINTAEVYYSSEVENVDFTTDDGINRINDWVKQKTNDKIQNILAPGSTDDLTPMVITNAVYFKGKWSMEFNPKNTSEKPFWLDKDNSVMVPMMKENVAIYNYAETDTLQALDLNYLGNDISMTILLPKENNGLKKLEQSIDKEKFDSIKSKMTRQSLTVEIPKFEFETKYDLKKSLKNLGLHDAFDKNKANFQQITDEQIYLDKAAHKAFVNVNEEGTEAAAITALVSRTTSGPPEPVAEFIADHPFMFIIHEKETGEILFIGRLVSP